MTSLPKELNNFIINTIGTRPIVSNYQKYTITHIPVMSVDDLKTAVNFIENNPTAVFELDDNDQRIVIRIYETAEQLDSRITEEIAKRNQWDEKRQEIIEQYFEDKLKEEPEYTEYLRLKSKYEY